MTDKEPPANRTTHPWGYEINAPRIARHKALKKVGAALKQAEDDKKRKTNR